MAEPEVPPPPPPPPLHYGWSLLADARQESLVKAVMTLLAGDEEEPVELYRRYLSSMFNPHVSNVTLSFLDKSALGRFYGLGEKRVEPKYCDIFVVNTLTKLEAVSRRRLVVLVPAARGNFTKLHDRRTFEVLAGDAISKKMPLFLLLDKIGRDWMLYQRADGGGFPQYRSVITETFLFWKSQTFGGCLVASARSALDVADNGLDEHVHGENCSSLSGFVFHDLDTLLASTGGTGFLLVTHLRTKPLMKETMRHLPSNNLFGVLATFKGSLPLDECSVLCVNPDLQVFCLKKPFALEVRKRVSRPRHPGRVAFPSPADAKEWLSGEEAEGEKPKATSAKDRKSLYKCCCNGCSSAPNWEPNMSRNGNQYLYSNELGIFDLLGGLGRRTPDLDARLHRCLALSAASFDVESVGSPLDDAVGNEDAFEYSPPEGKGMLSDVKMPQEVYAVQRPCLIGFVSQLMIESKQPTLVFRASNNEFNNVYEAVNEPLCLEDCMEGKFLSAVLEHKELARVVKAELLAQEVEWVVKLRRAHFAFYKSRGLLPSWHCDRETRLEPLPEEEEEEEGTLQDPLDEFEREIVGEIAQGLEAAEDPKLWRQQVMEEERERRRLGALLEDSEGDELEEAFERCAAQELEVSLKARAAVNVHREKRQIASVEASWNNSYLGKTEARLRRIISEYSVFAFNSSAYDLVVLGSRLCCYAKEVGKHHVTLAKDGRKWRFLKISGARFSEIKLLLGPGTSLAQLGVSCKLDTEENLKKGLFPFDAFKKIEFLDEPALPASALDWVNLLGKSPTQDEVDEALEEYRLLGCETVFDYLRAYLVKDCELLMRSITKMQAVYFALLGLNFMDVRKYTVSSLSASGVQRYLAVHLRPGFFCCNHARVFSLLKDGCRGGLTAVTRTAGGSSLDTEPFEALLLRQMEAEEAEVEEAESSVLEGGGGGGRLVMETLRGRLRRLGLTSREYVMGINSHLCDDPKPGKKLVYMDVASLYASAAKNSLPFLGFTLWDRVYGETFGDYDDDDDGLSARKKAKLEKRRGRPILRKAYGGDKEARPNPGDSLESLVAQYLVLEGFPQTELVFSGFHAGAGQTCLGSDSRRKADVMLTGPELNSLGGRTGRRALRYFNVDGLLYHGDGNHLDSCSKRPAVVTRNYRFLGCGGDVRNDENELKTAYCERLSLVHPEELVLSYVALHECVLSHAPNPPDCNQWGGYLEPKAAAEREERRLKYRSIRRLLKKTHPYDSVLGSNDLPRDMTQEGVVRRILAQDVGSQGGDWSGFVCVSGGRETSFEDFGPHRFAFLHQRTSLEPSNVGAFTRLQARTRLEKTGRAGPAAKHGEDSDDFLDRLAARQGTFVKSSLHEDGETIGCDLFRFLVLERGFVDYTINHVIWYRGKKFLTPFLHDMLQKRYDLRDKPGSDLMSGLLKLVINGFYGYCSLTQNTFMRSRVVGEATLRQYKRGHRLSPTSKDLHEISLLGAVRKLNKQPDLLYLLTMKRPHEKVFNCLQVSACILSESRNIMLGHQLVFLRFFDVRSLELCYHDTDSFVMLTASSDLSKCLKPHLSHRWAEVADLLFLDETKPHEQAGKLKLEGVWRGGLFRSIKAYRLWDPCEDTAAQVVVRVRGIARKTHAELKACHFTQDPEVNTVSVRTTSMMPTAGNQMMNLRSTKTMGCEYNLKRRAVDCVHTLPLR